MATMRVPASNTDPTCRGTAMRLTGDAAPSRKFTKETAASCPTAACSPSAPSAREVGVVSSV